MKLYSLNQRLSIFLMSFDQNSPEKKQPSPEFTVYIANLPFNFSYGDLKSMFEAIGPIDNLYVDHKRKGIAFVTYIQEGDSNEAVKTLDGKEFGGKVLFVAPYRKKTDDQKKNDDYRRNYQPSQSYRKPNPRYESDSDQNDYESDKRGRGSERSYRPVYEKSQYDRPQYERRPPSKPTMPMDMLRLPQFQANLLQQQLAASQMSNLGLPGMVVPPLTLNPNLLSQMPHMNLLNSGINPALLGGGFPNQYMGHSSGHSHRDSHREYKRRDPRRE